MAADDGFVIWSYFETFYKHLKNLMCVFLRHMCVSKRRKECILNVVREPLKRPKECDLNDKSVSLKRHEGVFETSLLCDWNIAGDNFLDVLRLCRKRHYRAFNA